jgi:hypothetical protein
VKPPIRRLIQVNQPRVKRLKSNEKRACISRNILP